MKKTFSFLTLFFLIMFQISCRQNDNISENFNEVNSLRQQFTAKKNQLEIKQNFFKLTTDQKISIWNNKFEQVLQQDLTNEQKKLLVKIKNDLFKIKNNDYQSLIDNSIKLASITNQKDFEAIFTTLNDANIKNDNNTSLNLYVEDLTRFKEIIKSKNLTQFKFSANSGSATSRELPLCIYRWLPLDTPAQPCQETESGCGWLFLQPCTH